MGLTGFGPVTFARNRVLGAVSTGFFLTAPEFRHSARAVSKPIVLLSGARRHPELDYSPTTTTKTHRFEIYTLSPVFHGVVVHCICLFFAYANSA
ncbi:MAG TPA: hypothetical protein VMS95_07225 [Candidatus Krumholzibacteriaceae bacterium]|nr:hypothetical protein [Candidatus Krumholzibacteriaceae bacterium]